MDHQAQTPQNVEQIAINNMVNIEAILECLVNAGVIKQEAFAEAKKAVEERILLAMKDGK